MPLVNTLVNLYWPSRGFVPSIVPVGVSMIRDPQVNVCDRYVMGFIHVYLIRDGFSRMLWSTFGASVR